MAGRLRSRARSAAGPRSSCGCRSYRSGRWSGRRPDAMPQPNVLIIDDEPLMRISIADALKAEGCQVKVATTGLEGMDLIRKEPFEIVITDLRLPGMDGLQILQACKEVSPTTGVIVITAYGSVETAVEAIKKGAYDYITKPFSMDELLLIVKRLVKVLELEDENRSLREELEGRFSFKGLLGKNDKMREVLEKIKLVAPTDSTVLIVGESGTGKELVANAIHHNSPRRDGAFIKVSCAALPQTLLETELFGHERGAFTGALRQRKGRVDLARHFVEGFAWGRGRGVRAFPRRPQALLRRYSFPGNVRERENRGEGAVPRAHAAGEPGPWTLWGFPACLYLGGPPQPTCGFCSEGASMVDKRAALVDRLDTAREQFERQYILKALERTKDNKTEAAKLLGLSRKALWEKCKRYGISKAANGANGEAE